MLTPRKKQFADYYLICLNQTEAARKAGYTSKRHNGLKYTAYRLMQEPDIKEYLADKLNKKSVDIIATQDHVLKYLSGCVLGTQKETHHYILKSGYKGEYNDTLIEKEIDLKARDRIKAAEVMAKIYKLMDQGKTEEPQKVIIQYDIPKGIKEDNE
jgi:phage terminase small subunit